MDRLTELFIVYASIFINLIIVGYELFSPVGFRRDENYHTYVILAIRNESDAEFIEIEVDYTHDNLPPKLLSLSVLAQRPITVFRYRCLENKPVRFRVRGVKGMGQAGGDEVGAWGVWSDTVRCTHKRRVTVK